MKKLLILCVFTLFNTYSFAETGKFNASGMGSWEVNVMDAGNGNMSITYDGNAGLSDKEDGSIFDKSTMHCIGGLTLTAGKFDDETGMCTFYLSDGEKVFINYKGKGTGGVGGSRTSNSSSSFTFIIYEHFFPITQIKCAHSSFIIKLTCSQSKSSNAMHSRFIKYTSIFFVRKSSVTVICYTHIAITSIHNIYFP